MRQREIDKVTGQVCDAWKNTPDDAPGLHSGSLAPFQSQGKTLMLCKKCTEELSELQAFMNRESTGVQQSLMHTNKHSDIRAVRLSFDDMKVPKTNLDILSPEVRARVNIEGIDQNNIVLLYAPLMQSALSVDGVTISEIASTARIPKQVVVEFVACKFPNPRVKYFYEYIRWVIEHEYTFNHLSRREDAQALMSGENKLRGAAATSSYRSQVRARLILEQTNSGLSQKKYSDAIGISFVSVQRAMSGKRWKELSVTYWNRIERAMNEYKKTSSVAQKAA